MELLMKCEDCGSPMVLLFSHYSCDMCQPPGTPHHKKNGQVFVYKWTPLLKNEFDATEIAPDGSFRITIEWNVLMVYDKKEECADGLLPRIEEPTRIAIPHQSWLNRTTPFSVGYAVRVPKGTELRCWKVL